ncbi:MAG: response regulator [Gammaproteobacteria bacterium]|nr:response regulator [Gammaproteobacteria bacterium]
MLEEWGIKNRVLIVSLLPTMIIAAMLGVYFTSTRLTDLEQSLKDHGTALSIQLTSSSEYGVFAHNKKILDKILENAVEDPEVSAITIYDKYGKELSHIGPKIDIQYNANRDKSPFTIINNEEKQSLIFVAPIMLRDVIIEDFSDNINSPNRDVTQSSVNQKVIGWVNIELSKENTILKQYQALFTSGCILLFGLLVSGLFAKRLGRDVTSPIIKLTGAVRKIKDGEFATRVYTGASGELKILESGINSMANSLKIAHNEMQNNVDEATRELRQTLETIEIQNAELDIARKEALAASRVKSEFLANMSHEIRTPMNGILGFTQLLLKTPITSQQYDYLMTINQSGNSLLQIINDILDFSKIEAGKLELDFRQFDLLDCLEESIAILAPLAHHKNLELVPIIYSDVPRMIITDSLRLKQVITNLANNAIKFTDSGSVVIRIMLDAQTQPSAHALRQNRSVKIKVTVTDTGIGLTNHEKNKLFRAFSQADTTTARKFGGTGLGLAISKKLVHKMDGKIGFETTSGEGSVFWFTFKAKIPSGNESQHILKKDLLLPNNIGSKTILICEQHPITRLSIKYLLKSWGIDTLDISDIKLIPDHLTNIDLIIYGLNDLTNYKEDINALIAEIKIKNFQTKPELAILVNTSDQIIHDEIRSCGVIFCVGKPILHKKLFENLLIAFNNSVNSHDGIQDNSYTSNTQARLNTEVLIDSATVLAVDDNFANLKLIETLLKSFGITVVTASSGLNALELIKQKRFDLIFMDIQMPNLDGIETTKAINNYYTENNITKVPIVAVTAHAIIGEQEKLIKQGLQDYLSKPIDEEELLIILGKWLHKNAPISKYYKAQNNIKITNQSSKIIDWELSLKLANYNIELAKELLNLLLTELPKDLNAIKQAYKTKNYDEFYHLIHKLHGSCCYCGLPLLKAACFNLESQIKKSKNFNDYIKTMDKFILQANAVITEFPKILIPDIEINV